MQHGEDRGLDDDGEDPSGPAASQDSRQPWQDETTHSDLFAESGSEPSDQYQGRNPVAVSTANVNSSALGRR